MQSEKWDLNRLDLWAEVALNLLNEAGAVFKGDDSYLAPRHEAVPPAPSVAVKALEWNPYRAETPFGYYEIYDQRDVPESELKGRLPFLLFGSRLDYSRHPTLEAARAAAQADYEARIRSALSAQVQDVATHRHKKRGTEYVLIGVGKIQVENWCEFTTEVNHTEGREYAFVGKAVDMREVAIYRSVDDCSLWVRPIEEFNDGRFQPLAAAPAKQEG